MIILLDADDVLENLSSVWIPHINAVYGTDTDRDKLTERSLEKAFPTLTREQIFATEADEEIYDSMQPLPKAPEYVKRLMDEGHDVLVVTNTPYQAAYSKYCFFQRHFPFIPWTNFILTKHKQRVMGDVLVDDYEENLIGGDYEKIYLSTPWNRHIDAEALGLTRVENWDEIYEAIQAIDRKRKAGGRA